MLPFQFQSRFSSLESWIKCILAFASSTLLITSSVYVAISALDITTGVNLVLDIALSIATMIFTVCPCEAKPLSYSNKTRSQFHGYKNRMQTRAPTVLAVAWCLPTTIGLTMSFQQPLCRRTGSGESHWREGTTCYIFRTIVGLSILVLITICMFCHVRGKQRHVLSLYMADSKSGVFHSATSSEVSYRDNQAYSRSASSVPSFEHEQWVQRRNSVSSQRAIYPYNHRVFTPYRSRGIRSQPSQLCSLSETSEQSLLDTTDTVSARNSSRSYSGLMTNSSGHISAQSSLWGMPSCVPERFGLTKLSRLPMSEKVEVEEVIDLIQKPQSPPPPAWCPSKLTQEPLSADPQIHALSTGAGTHLNTLTKLNVDGKSVTVVHALSKSHRSYTAPAITIVLDKPRSRKRPSRHSSQLRSSISPHARSSLASSSNLYSTERMAQHPRPQTVTRGLRVAPPNRDLRPLRKHSPMRRQASYQSQRTIGSQSCTMPAMTERTTFKSEDCNIEKGS